MRVKRVKVALTTEVLLPEYAHHLKGENYVVSIDLDEERGRGRGRGQPKQLVWVWNKVKEGYGHVMQKKWRESFVLTLPGGVRLNPSNGVNEGDTIEVCKPLPWEDELWRNQSNQIAANAAATSTDVERVGSDENGGGGHLSLPVTPTEQRVEVTRPSRSSIRKAKKRKHKRLERLKETKLLDFGAEKEKENAGGALEAPKVKKVKSVVDDYVDEQRTDQYFNFAMKSVGVEREGLSTAQDYDSCPKLEGQLPNVGTKIAYKVLEVEGGCPILSDYRKGVVHDANEETKKIVVLDEIGTLDGPYEGGRIEDHISVFRDIRILEEGNGVPARREIPPATSRERKGESAAPSVPPPRYKSREEYFEQSQNKLLESRRMVEADGESILIGRKEIKGDSQKKLTMLEKVLFQPTQDRLDKLQGVERNKGNMSKKDKRKCMQMSVGNLASQLK